MKTKPTPRASKATRSKSKKIPLAPAEGLAKRRRGEEALRKSEERYRLLFNSMSDV